MRRIGIACAVFAAVLAVPASAEAAEWLTIDGAKHEAGVPAAAENGTWKWDGKDALELNGYNGGVISAGGKLEITCVGENSLACSEGTDGILVDYNVEGGEAANLAIKGPGSLSVKTGGQVGSIQSAGDITVSGISMKIESTEYEVDFGLLSLGKTRIENGSDVEIASRMNGIAGYGLEVDGSKVTVKNSNTTGDIAVSYGFQIAGPVTITNGSSVDIQINAPESSGIYSVVRNDADSDSALSVSDPTGGISAVSSVEQSQNSGALARGTGSPNLISIVDSTVVSECTDGVSLISADLGAAGSEASTAGKIDLEGCEVVSPEGGYICNLNSKYMAVEGDESEELGLMAGQFIGTSDTEDAVVARAIDGGYVTEWPNSVSKKVVIKPIAAPESPTVPPVVDSTDNSTTPSTPGATKPSDTAGKPAASEQPIKKPAQDKASGSVKTKKKTGAAAGNLPATGDASAILPVSIAALACCAFLLVGITWRRRSE